MTTSVLGAKLLSLMTFCLPYGKDGTHVHVVSVPGPRSPPTSPTCSDVANDDDVTIDDSAGAAGTCQVLNAGDADASAAVASEVMLELTVSETESPTAPDLPISAGFQEQSPEEMSQFPMEMSQFEIPNQLIDVDDSQSQLVDESQDPLHEAQDSSQKI